MHQCHQTRPILFVLLASIWATAHGGSVQAQDRWPPWQSYGEAEHAARPWKRSKRQSQPAIQSGAATPTQQERAGSPAQATSQPVDAGGELEALNKQVAQLRQVSKYAEAVPVARRALALAEQLYGLDDPSIEIPLENLAAVCSAQDQFAEAEQHYRRLLSLREEGRVPTTWTSARRWRSRLAPSGAGSVRRRGGAFEACACHPR